MLTSKKGNTFILGLILLIFGLDSNHSFGQANKETAAQMVEIGDEILNQTLAVMEARELYVTAANMDPDNVRANYMSGVTTLQSTDKGAATQYFLRVFELDPDYSFDILYLIGEAYHYDYQFNDAIAYYNRYKQKLASVASTDEEKFANDRQVERKLYECEQGKIMVEFPENVEIINVGPEINSANDDYAPVVNQDENLLIFTSRRQEGNMNPDVASDNYPFEDIFFSVKNGSNWSEAQNIGPQINTLYHDSNVGLSTDGTELFIYKDENGGDILEAKRDENGQWSNPESLGKRINTANSETTVSLSPDGQTMFFASDRKGGHGGLDIWITHKNKRGEWASPQNLGPEINTPYNEDGAFIGYDGKTLYFSSEGGEGMGGFDIYRVTYDSTSMKWGPPSNMGYPINSPDDDIYFVPAKDGKRAYYASVRDDGFGYTDIYVLKIPESLKYEDPDAIPEAPPEPRKVLAPVILHVTVLNEKDIKTDAKVTIRPIAGMDTIPTMFAGTGEYSFSTTKDEPIHYYLSVKKLGYESQSIIVQNPPSEIEPIIKKKTVKLIKKPDGI